MVIAIRPDIEEFESISTSQRIRDLIQDIEIAAASVRQCRAEGARAVIRWKNHLHFLQFTAHTISLKVEQYVRNAIVAAEKAEWSRVENHLADAVTDLRDICHVVGA